MNKAINVGIIIILIVASFFIGHTLKAPESSSSEITSLQEQISNLQQQNSQIQNSLQQKNISIQSLNNQIEELKNQLEEPTPSQQLTIKTGTSFGECLGYCKNDITITSQKIVFHKSGRDQDGLLPEITEEVPITSEEWNALSNSLDFEKFKSLDDTIGCPDCADGGAEWIEINDGKTTKKVTFEYNDTISEIDNLIIELRKIRNDVFSRFED